MAELIRRAIGEMRHREEAKFQGLLNQTAGIWKQGDGLEYQQNIRGEWDRGTQVLDVGRLVSPD